VELDNHSILPDSRLSSDHAPLSIEIPIGDEIIHSAKLIIPPRSKQEMGFIEDIISNLKSIDTSNIEDITCLDHIVNQVGCITERMWSKNAKKSKFSKHSKQWWSDSCCLALNSYRVSRSQENWKTFKLSVKEAKQSFFDNKIQEIANKSHGPWELMNWVKKRKLPATEAIEYNNRPCLTPNSLWDALHNMFNIALHRQAFLMKSIANWIKSGCLFPDMNSNLQSINALITLLQDLTKCHGVIGSSSSRIETACPKSSTSPTRALI